jgi:hypothetical protein
MSIQDDPVERAQVVRERAIAGLERADELVRRVDELTARISAHRRVDGYEPTADGSRRSSD